MADPSTRPRGELVKPTRGGLRYTPVGSIVLSPDFYVGIPAGIAISLIPAFFIASANNATTLLIAFGSVLVGVAAVVVAVKTIFVTLLGDDYVAALERVPGGVKGAAKPYVIVAWVCIVGALVSFAAALSWPAIPTHHWWLTWLCFAVPAAMTAWGLLGCAQLVSLAAFHVEQRAILMKAVRDFRQRRDDTSRSA